MGDRGGETERLVPHATKRDYEIAFAGLDFPTSKSAIISRARDNGGIDREVYAILDRLPEHPYNSTEELQDGVRAIYLADGVPSESLPI
jgi:hypothetical protein